MFRLDYVRQGKFEVQVNGALITTHNQEKDALESLTAETVNNPNADVRVVPNFTLVANVTMPDCPVVDPTPIVPPVVTPPAINYNNTKDIIIPDYTTVPNKGDSFVIPETGIKVTRLTDASEFAESSRSLIVYSRYTPENTAGDLFLVFGANSTSCSVQNRLTGAVIGTLFNGSKTIGEAHEVRWDISGNHPYRVYFRYGMTFNMIDDVRTPSVTLIKDFSSLFPTASRIYNDVEGDSSNDSDHWGWMAAYYNGSTYKVLGYIHYQISTDTTHTMVPADLAGSNLDIEKGYSEFRDRPNMVEINPTGTGFVIHSGRKWDDVAYGGHGADYIGTWFDGAHLWPFDFDWATKAPLKISVGETHSGWAFDSAGREMFVSQNNRTDRLDCIYTDNGALVTSGSHADFSWDENFHYGKMPPTKTGWLFMCTYSSQNDSWADNQFVMIETKDEAVARVFRIGHNFNLFSGNYRDEAPAAINSLGNRIYVSSNWGGALPQSEVFVYELPEGWEGQ